MRLSLADVARATGGLLADATGAERVHGSVVVDSRRVRPGSLFVAVDGEHVDGHDFAAAALAAGAAGVLAARPVGVPAVVVDGGTDGVITALGRLAHAVLAAAPDVTVTAITGSSGKTGTKDLIAQVLPRSGPTLASEGSFNNDLGVPLTVLRLAPAVRHLVLEMGSRGAGHIARLCRIAPPEIGVVLNVGTAHVGEFGSPKGIAAAKGELVAALPPGGTAVLNIDDPLVTAMAAASAAPVLWFGTAAGADVTATRVTLDEEGRPSFRLHTTGGSAEVGLQLVGEHHVANALAAAAVAHQVGMSVDVIANALSAAGVRSRWRMEVHRRPDGVTVINDAYNANPDSVRAALRALVAVGRGGRTWAVLGEMLELGDRSAVEHDGIGRLAARLGITRVVVVGAGAHPIHLGASDGPWGVESVAVPDRAAALALLRAELRRGDTVLVKSSRDAGLRQLGEDLVGDGPGEDFVIAVLISGAVALIISLFGTPLAIRGLVTRGYGQLIRDDGPTSHHTKRGTPTMGGGVIILSVLGGYLVSHLIPVRPPSASGLLVLFLMTGLGLVGLADDFIKISKQRSLGLRAWTKVVGQGLVAVLFGIGALMFENERGLTPASAAISFVRDSSVVLPTGLFVVWAFLMIVATSNAVNLTDGLDGLATGTTVMVSAAYMVVAAWQLGQSCEFMNPATPKCYEVRDSRDLAVVAAALLGACFGFLWWNAAPAKIFMGDTGSLALGGAIAGLAILTRTELLLVLLGGLFAIITTSVIIQVGWFKATGKRVFRMAPLQHHFELKGWGEVTIVIRFWIIAGLCTALGLGVFYADWVAR